MVLIFGEMFEKEGGKDLYTSDLNRKCFSHISCAVLDEIGKFIAVKIAWSSAVNKIATTESF